MAKLWCEARCDGQLDIGHYRGGCHETSPGDFGVKDATMLARKSGWITSKGDWLCPYCKSRVREGGEANG